MTDITSSTVRGLSIDRGLPYAIDIERLVLGAILVRPESYSEVAAILGEADYGTEADRHIARAMRVLFEKSEPIDRVSVANELMRVNELNSVGGMSYLIDLDNGLPPIYSVSNYAKIVKEKSVARQIIFQSQHTVNLLMTNEATPKEVVESTIGKFIDILPSDDLGGPQPPAAIIKTLGLNAFLSPHLHRHGIKTGFVKLDDMTGGFQEGDLIIIAGRPSHGKSALTLNICEYITMQCEKRIVLFSLEMSKVSLLHRLVCSLARVDLHKFRTGYVNAEERGRLNAAANLIESTPQLLIDDSTALTTMDIHAKLRQLRSRGEKPDLVAIDYLQLMASKNKIDNRVQEISQITRHLKLLAKDHQVPLVVLSQLNRAPELRKGNNRPQLSDLRESGSIEQDADVVGGIFREELYVRDREDLRGIAELILLKQRNGPVGVVKLAFLHHLAKFTNLADDLGPDNKSGDWKESAAGERVH